jgi:hypothetical protein
MKTNILISLVLLTSCGSEGVVVITKPCTTIQIQNGAIISCPNGSASIINNGVTGATGETGNTGTTGVTGSTGQNGTSSSLMIASAPTTQCPDGGYEFTVTTGNTNTGTYSVCNGTMGQTGPTGSIGATGATGAQGAAGVANISIVQFCPGNTSYPNEFNEIGICINNNLYAVYSQNDGFLTEVLPGTYSSDGINASCTFTVEPNCVVIQN